MAEGGGGKIRGRAPSCSTRAGKLHRNDAMLPTVNQVNDEEQVAKITQEKDCDGNDLNRYLAGLDETIKESLEKLNYVPDELDLLEDESIDVLSDIDDED